MDRRALIAAAALAPFAFAPVADAAAPAIPPGPPGVLPLFALASNAYKIIFTGQIPGKLGTFGVNLAASLYNTSSLDPVAQLGYVRGTGETSSFIGVEAYWDTGPGANQPVLAEYYWDTTKNDGTTFRPFYGTYDVTNQLMVDWVFQIGNGRDASTARPGNFQILFDTGSGSFGVNCFIVKPNTMDLYAISSGGIAAAQTRINMHSSNNGNVDSSGSALALSFLGGDPTASGVQFLIKTEAFSSTSIYTHGIQAINIADSGGNPYLGFFGKGAVARQTVSGSRSSATVAVLTALLAAIGAGTGCGLINDSTTA